MQLPSRYFNPYMLKRKRDAKRAGSTPVVDAPVASFTYVENYLEVTFTDTSTNDPTEWSWDFGDGVGTSTEQNPVYEYAEAGDYTVTLVASNAGGNDDYSEEIGVVPAAPENTVLPSIDDTTPIVGQTLTGSDGTWINPVTSYERQWRRSGVDISGATNQTYVVVDADFGHTLTYRVTASGPGGETVAEGEATGAVYYTYHIDSVNGSDANDGSTPELAFATLGALPALQAGETVGLARGSSWREQLTLPANSIGVYAYGAGDRPIIDGADTITNADFTKTDGQTNVYQVTVSPALDATDTFVRAWEDGAKLTRATSLANCDATAGSYYPSASAGTPPITLYIHPTGSTDPTSDGKLYEHTQRQFCIDAASRNNITVADVVMKRGMHYAGCAKFGRNALIERCDFLDGTKHNLLVADGSALVDVLLSDAQYNAAASLFVANETLPAGLGVTLTRVRAEMPVYTPTIDAFLSHHNSGLGAGSFGAIVAVDCEAENVGNVFAFNNALTVTVTGGTIGKCKQLLLTTIETATYMLDGVACDSRPGVGSLGIPFIQNGAENQSITLVDCDITVDQPQTALIAILQNNVSLTLLRTRLTTVLAAPCVSFQTNKTGCVWNMHDSMLDARNAQQIIVNTTADLPDYAGDNNCFMRTGQVQQFAGIWNGSSHNTIAAWQSATGQESNSTVGGC